MLRQNSIYTDQNERISRIICHRTFKNLWFLHTQVHRLKQKNLNLTSQQKEKNANLSKQI